MWGRSSFWKLIREGLSEVTCKSHGLPGKLRPSWGQKKCPILERASWEQERGPCGRILVREEKLRRWGMTLCSQWWGLTGTVGMLNATPREMGTWWGLGFKQRMDLLWNVLAESLWLLCWRQVYSKVRRAKAEIDQSPIARLTKNLGWRWLRLGSNNRGGRSNKR